MYFQRLRDLREDMDMNQTEIAKLLHTSQTVYSRYERGFQTIPVEHLLILADFYQVSTDYLLGREETTPTPSLPLPGEVLKIYHGKSVWSSDYGWVLVNSIKSVLICVDGSMIPFENAGSVYAAQPPFYEATLPDTKPMSKYELSNYSEVWLEPISHDATLREELRGWYRVSDRWVENDHGNRFSIDTYGSKWLAFTTE